jgi:para-nitrobenzyl esterase
MIFGAQNFTWANRQAESQKNRTFVYRFTRKVPGNGQYAKYGAFHTGEVPYVFDNLNFVDRPWEKTDHQLAETMSNYWLNFVKSGDPNGPGLPKWPIYQVKEKEIILLGKEMKSQSISDAASLEFVYSVLLN